VEVFHELEWKHHKNYWKIQYSDGKLYILEKSQADLHIIDVVTKSVAKISLKNKAMGPRLIEQVTFSSFEKIPIVFKKIYILHRYP
jgi:hypothetical protein